ncbi:MAG: choice-of-anchor L domain-containing protein [Saprospiraceae bacterium]
MLRFTIKLKELVFLLFFPSFCFAQQNGTVVLDVSGGLLRQEFYFSGDTCKVELTGLAKGKPYTILSAGGEDCRPQIRQAGRVYEKEVIFTASGEKETFTIIKDKGNCNLPFWFSIYINEDRPAVKNPMQKMAKLTVNNNVPVLSLIQDVFIGGDCFSISDVKAIGDPSGRGTFAKGSASIGIESGVLLCTGDVSIAEGPNTSPSVGDNLIGPSGDPDLITLSAGGDVRDVQGVEFDFIPTVDNVGFTYVFASEEYCEWVGSVYNDVFGFFISGPGINGGFTFQGENIAVLPGSGINVAINNVNHIDNTAYFSPNWNNGFNSCGGTTNMTDIQFDGWTKVLTAMATVVPCETYHIRLIVGDVGDPWYDSAVFFKANSFSAGSPVEATAFSAVTDTNLVYESCNDGVVRFIRTGDLSLPQTVHWTVDTTSTATPGIDYDVFPDSINFLAGQDTVFLYLNVINDGLGEGIETILLNIESTCSCDISTLTIEIEDPPTIEATIDDQEICEGETTILSPTVNSFLNIPSFVWDTGDSTPMLTVAPDITTSYQITVTDECGSTATAFALVNVIPLEEATLIGGGVICTDAQDTVQLAIDFTGSAPWTFVYSKDGVQQAAITTLENPFIINVNESGTFVLDSIQSDGCYGTVTGFSQVTESEVVLSAISTTDTCGLLKGSIDLSPSGGAAPYHFNWSSADTLEDLQNVAAGDYSVTVTDQNNCTAELSMTVGNENPSFNINPSIIPNTSCLSLSPNGGISISISPPIPPGSLVNYSILWSNGETAHTLADLPPGNYEVTVSTGGECSQANIFEIPDESAPIMLTGAATDVLCFGENTGSIELTANDGSAPYSFSWSPNISGDPEDPTELFAGGYEVTATDANGCTASMDFLISQPPDLVQTSCAQISSESTVGANDGVATVDISGGTIPYQITWPGGNQNGIGAGIFDITNLGGGAYNVVVVDANGCESTCNLNINVCATSVGNMNIAPISLCGTGCLTADYDDSAAYLEPDDVLEFILHTGAANLIVDELSRNDVPTFCFDPMTMQLGITYYISAAAGNNDGNGHVDLNDECTEVSFGTPITFHERPIASVNPPDILTCAVTEVDLIGTSTISGSTFNWFTNSGIISGSPVLPNSLATAEGIYTLVVVSPNSTCADTISAEVLDISSTILANIVASPTEVLDCNISFVTLSGSATGGANLELLWTSSNGLIATSSVINVNEGGSYQLIATDPLSACADTTQVVIAEDDDYPPLFADTPPTLSCANTIVEINGGSPIAGVDFNWATIANGDTSLIANGPTTMVTVPGIYWLFGTAGNGCNNAISIEVNGDFTVPAANAGDDQNIGCDQAAITLTGSSDYTNVSFSWSSAEPNILITDPTNPSILADAAGLYTLTVTLLSSGCTATDEMVVGSLEPVPPATLYLQEPTCFGLADGAITVSVDLENEPYEYRINGTSNGQSDVFSPLSSGSYLIEVTNSFGCQWATQIYLPEPDPLFVELGPDLEIDLGEEVTIQALYPIPDSQLDTILWQPAEWLLCPKMVCDLQQFTPFGQMDISATIIDKNGCEASDQVQLLVRKERHVYIPNAFSPNNDGVNDLFVVYSNDAVLKIKQLLVFSRWGESVFEYYNFPPNDPLYGWDGKHRGEKINPGVFAWFAVIKFIDGEEVLFEGDVILME